MMDWCLSVVLSNQTFGGRIPAWSVYCDVEQDFLSAFGSNWLNNDYQHYWGHSERDVCSRSMFAFQTNNVEMSSPFISTEGNNQLFTA